MQDPSRGRTVLATAGATGRGALRFQVRRAWPTVREILLVLALFMTYKIGRLVAVGHVGEALANAGRVLSIERHLPLPGEPGIQRLIIDHRPVIRAANIYYAYVHFPATALCLIWVYLRRQSYYRWIRSVLALLTASALALHLLTPLAPPRMIAAMGMVDTAQVYGPAVYGPPTTDTLSNQYAAMPSLHVGWAVAVAIVLIAATRSRWRWCWLAHPVATLAVVVATGNHYWLDAIVAVVLLGMALLLVPGPVVATRTSPADRIATAPAA